MEPPPLAPLPWLLLLLVLWWWQQQYWLSLLGHALPNILTPAINSAYVCCVIWTANLLYHR